MEIVAPPEKYWENCAGAVFTGASSGIGQAILKAVHQHKRELVFCNLSRSKPEGLPDGLNLRHFPCDLSRGHEVEARVPEVVEHLRRAAPQGRVLLFNNSGFGAYGPFPEPALEHHLEMLEVNVRAPVRLTGLLLPFLRERGGTVVNIASTAAFQPTPFLATYGASKSFLLHWSLALHQDLRGTGVRTLAVCPGPTATRFFRRAGFQEAPISGWGQTAEQVAAETVRALVRGRTLVVTGWPNRWLVLASSLLPKRLQAVVAGLVLRQLRLEARGKAGVHGG